MRRRAVCLLLLVAVGISACGRPDALQPPPDEPTVAPTAPLAASPGGAESAYPPVMDSAYPPAVADSPYPFAEPAAAYPALEAATSTVDEWTLRANPTATPIVELTPVAHGPLLREVLPPVPQSTPATTHLIYSELIVPPDGSFGQRNIFWEIDLRDLQRTHLAEVSTMSWGALHGTLAPDGSHLAYIDTPFESSILRVMRPDGSADREIAHGVGDKLPFCRERFAWSPTSTQLVYVADDSPAEPFTDELWLYDVASGSQRQVTQGGWMLLLGWQDADHVLALVAHSYDQPRRFELLAIADGQRQVLGTLPRPMGVNCEQLSPDGTKVLLGLDYGSTLFDLTTQQYQGTGIEIGWTGLWLPGSSMVLQEPVRAGQPAFLFRLPAMLTKEALTLAPPVFTNVTRLEVLGIAPDGRYLLICEKRTEGISPSINRPWLYTVATDQWQVLPHESFCGAVIGWRSEP